MHKMADSSRCLPASPTSIAFGTSEDRPDQSFRLYNWPWLANRVTGRERGTDRHTRISIPSEYNSQPLTRACTHLHARTRGYYDLKWAKGVMGKREEGGGRQSGGRRGEGGRRKERGMETDGDGDDAVLHHFDSVIVAFQCECGIV